MDITEIGIPLEAVNQRLWTVLVPEADPGRKLLVARAAIPLPPDQLVPALAFLTNDPSPEVRKLATATLRELPASTVDGILRAAATNPGVLDRLARVFISIVDHLVKIALNRAVADETLLFLAKRGKGAVLEIIGQNQARIATCPQLVQLLYYNRNSKMSTISRVVEFAVREDLPIQSMPGYKEIVAAVMGDARLARPGARPDEPEEEAPAEAAPAAGFPPEAQPEAEAPVPAASPEEDLARAFEAELAGADDGFAEEDLELAAELGMEGFDSAEQEMFGELAGEAGEGAAGDGWGELFATGDGGADGESDEAFFAVLAAAMDEEGMGDDGESESIFIADQIKEMGIPDKVRLALMGNASARDVLVRDANKLVATAVLRNPGLSDREVLSYAGNRNVAQDVIRIIAASREWVRNYTLKVALIQNPKTPPPVAMQFLRHLRGNDLKSVSKNRDVPSVVVRMAKRLLQEKRIG